MDVDSNSFTSQELKKALAKMKESEKAERKVRKRFPVSEAMHSTRMLTPYVARLRNMVVKVIARENPVQSLLVNVDLKYLC